MATGRSNKLVGQTGEYLVAAELSRRGLIATTFTGNVPHYDIIASDDMGRHVSVQVKATRGTDWQFNISRFCEIRFEGERQIMGTPLTCPVRGLVVVLVHIGEYGKDRFYVCTWLKLRDLLVARHQEYLLRHKGIRSKRWDSMHTVLEEASVIRYIDNWNVVQRGLR